MKKKLSKENLTKCFVAGLCALLTGCGSIGLAREASFESAYENVPEEEVEIYTSEGCGVLEGIDAEGGTITIYQIDKKDEMILSYDGATEVRDKFGSPLVMTQLLPGELVAVRYNSELQKAGSVTIPSDAWSYDNVSKYDIDEGRGTLQVGSDTYRISGNTKIFSGSEQISLNQILKQDVLSLKGTERDIFSIVVENGHGYLDLENDDELIGGWIEVGQAVIQQITEDMLITIPEGSYMVRLTANGVDETREITIARNEETVLDVGDIEVPRPVNGRVVFSVLPQEAGANVFVDGVGVDISYTVLLPFGLHQITASASGYDTISEYFNVEEENTTVKLVLSEAEESTTVSGNTSEESDKKEYHTITIQAPSDVEVYQDNLYMGISPVTYEKKAGDHTITLRKQGYVTKSYQIVVEDDDRDLSYSFPDLTAEDAFGASTVSGNSVYNNSADSNSEKRTSTVSGNTIPNSNEQDLKDENSAETTVSGNN